MREPSTQDRQLTTNFSQPPPWQRLFSSQGSLIVATSRSESRATIAKSLGLGRRGRKAAAAELAFAREILGYSGGPGGFLDLGWAHAVVH